MDTMPVVQIGILAFVVGLSATSCGKSDSGKSNSANFDDLFCAEVVKCCSQAGLSPDGVVCHRSMQSASIGASFNAAAADACLAEIKAQQTAGTFCTDQASMGSCAYVYELIGGGTRQPGETCDMYNVCAPSSDGHVACTAFYEGNAWIGRCQVLMAGKIGDSPCAGTQDGNTYEPISASEIVARGYVCDTAQGIQCQDGACVALVAFGGSCTSSTDCVRGGYCDSSNACTVRVSVGGVCNFAAGFECVAGAYCDTNDGKCKTKLPIGAACTIGDGCESDKCSSGTCQDGSNITITQFCGS